MSDTSKKSREATLKELVEYYEDPDFVRFTRESDDGEGDEVFYVIDADLLDSVITVLGGKVKPAAEVVDFDEFTGDEDGEGVE